MKDETFKRAFDGWEVLIHPFETRIILPREVDLKGVEKFRARFWIENGKTFIEWKGDFVKFAVVTDYLIETSEIWEEADVRIIAQDRVKYWEGLSQCVVWLHLYEILKGR